MNEVLKKLADWNCDVKGAIERFVDNEEMYISFLPTVANEPAFEVLGKALESGDAREVFEQAHLLKGVVANMGLTPILEEVVKIVEPARAGSIEGLEPYYEALMQRLAEFKKILE